MYCWARYLFVIVVSVLALGQIIAACGQKGDLYLPEPEKTAQPAQSQEEDVPAPAVQKTEPPKSGEEHAAGSEAGSRRGE